jgi:hypothetical protein
MDVTTDYVGLDGIRRLEDHCAAAVVRCSTFEEQMRYDSAALERLFNVGRDSFDQRWCVNSRLAER